ncbi:MAG: ABC transporter permease [Gulosibacter sp.]|uniref:ABC transporter permease n=1 Tax=Gulosibacter sp. TaxID=2817531 RepID=UPI003F92145E
MNEPPRHVAQSMSRDELRLRKEMQASDFIFEVEVAYGDLSHLTKVGGRPSLLQYIREIWERRHFIWRESRKKVATGNAQDRLGIAWLVIRPLLDAIFYIAIFGLVLQAGHDVENYVAFVIIGVFMFQLTSAAISGGTTAMRSSRAMIRAFSFPRASIIVAILLRSILERLPAMAVMLLIIILWPPHELPTLAWALVPAVFGLQTILNFALGLIFARFGASFPDMANAVSFVVRILMYTSAVIFPITRFEEFPVAVLFIEANPIYIILEMYRTILIGGTVPLADSWMSAAAWAFGLCAFGLVWFWKGEESYAREQ